LWDKGKVHKAIKRMQVQKSADEFRRVAQVFIRRILANCVATNIVQNIVTNHAR